MNLIVKNNAEKPNTCKKQEWKVIFQKPGSLFERFIRVQIIPIFEFICLKLSNKNVQ